MNCIKKKATKQMNYPFFLMCIWNYQVIRTHKEDGGKPNNLINSKVFGRDDFNFFQINHQPFGLNLSKLKNVTALK
jgi:hypothetical protein